ncbi:GDSL ESTERASE/LIPASE [Salix purpurea]|uniref:GDSL ESTERASE/LIPASE n=1 Tax=Salix purpurea TaxID=77065 RepID=A0A9Q0WJX8_SALPP|nr:GDSL ESTERASE/LIPASE [Salix purpurea]
MVTVLALMALMMPLFSGAVDIRQLRQLAARHNVTCVLVFGDSSVDPGNNNRLPTTMKGNFPPYGKDFFDRHPTGRFSNGRLATDFIAEALGYTKIIPAFLDPNLKPADLLHGVSFASAASGYDDLTANLSQVLPVSKQIEYLKHYKLHLSRLNYFLEPTRPKQFTVEQYQNFLASRMFQDIKEMNRLGATRVVVVGVPPLGCMPLVKTLADQNTCVERYNQAAWSFNAKIKEKLAILRKNNRA